MDTLEELLRASNPKGQLIRATAKNIAVTLDELHKQGGEVLDPAGLAVAALYKPIADKVAMAQPAFGGSHLRRMEELGLVTLQRNAKKTYAITVVRYPTDIEKWLPEELQAVEPESEPEYRINEEAMDELVHLYEDEAQVLGSRPGRLAARIERTIPDIVALAVSQAVDSKFDQMIRGMGYAPESETGGSTSTDIQEVLDANARLVAVTEQLQEELRVERQLHEFTRSERNKLIASDNGGVIAGSLRPSQLHRDLREIGQWALDNGFFIHRTNGGHILFRHAGGGEAVYSASTPSDYRGTKNLRADLERVVRNLQEQ